jgi:uncharacterized protein (TIGR03435 family)
MYAIVKPIKTPTSGAFPRPGHITADGVPLSVLVGLAYQTDDLHTDWRMPKDSQTFRAAFRVPDDRKERLLPYMRQTLADLFGFRAQWENQDRDVFILRRIEGHAGPAESQAGEALVQMMRGKITLRKQSIGELCRILANSFRAVVVDETGWNGRYDFDLPYQPGQPEVVVRALADIGLEAVKARRTLPILVVTPTEPPPP